MQLGQIVIENGKIDDLSFLETLKKLTSITIQTDQKLDYQMVNNFDLKRLSIVADDAPNWSNLGNLRSLNWIVLAGEISQNDFDKVLDRNSKLNVVEMLFCEQVNSLQSLSLLNELKAVAISDELNDRQSILELSNLEYLTLPKEVLEDSIFAQQLTDALPTTEIVPNEGFCMDRVGYFLHAVDRTWSVLA